MMIRIWGKHIKVDLRWGQDFPDGHTGPCVTAGQVEATSGGQFELGFRPTGERPEEVDRGNLEQRPVGVVVAGAFRGAGCGVLHDELTGRFHVRSRS